MAFDFKLCKQYWGEPILQNSLTRSVNLTTIENQFHRITLGQAKLTKYNFAYEIGKINSGIKLTFDVIPNSLPPTNIHVLIGGNGIGKTTLIKDMVEGILSNDQDSGKGRFSYNYSDSIIHSAQFANVICVAFSPFDDFSLFEKYEKKADSSFEKYERFSYIGTKKKYHFGDGNRQEVKNLLDDIEDNFVSSLKSCLGNLTKREDLADVIGILENDPIFFNYRIGELIIGNDASIDYNDMTLFRKIFSSMSSGHKVVLSTIVRCIDKMVEKTVLFLDEPENHLHASDEEKARLALDRVTEKWTAKYPNSMKRWYDNWDAITPIFKFSPDVRKVIYTTNAIESLNSTYRKLNRQRSVFPSDTALLKALYLATFEATKKWTMSIRNWGHVYGELSIMYEGRLPE